MRISLSKAPLDPQPSDPSRVVATLADLRAGASAFVDRVEGGDALAQRLTDQGLWPGVEVRRIAHAIGGDPILFALQGYRLALRVDEAARVRVRECAQ